MLVDEELTVSTIDRVVQNALVQPDLDVLRRKQRTAQRKGVADLGWHGIADAFLLVALDDLRAIGISERDPDRDADAALISKNSDDARVLGEEQGAVGEDVDLMLGGFEESCPDLAGNRPPMRIDGTQFFRSRPRR